MVGRTREIGHIFSKQLAKASFIYILSKKNYFSSVITHAGCVVNMSSVASKTTVSGKYFVSLSNHQECHYFRYGNGI